MKNLENNILLFYKFALNFKILLKNNFRKHFNQASILQIFCIHDLQKQRTYSNSKSNGPQVCNNLNEAESLPQPSGNGISN